MLRDLIVYCIVFVYILKRKCMISNVGPVRSIENR